MRKKKILLWAPLGSGLHYWGPGLSAYRLYSIGLPQNIEVDLAHGFKNQSDPLNLFSNTFFIADLNKWGLLGKFIFFIKAWLFIRKAYKEYDVVHCLGAFEVSFRPALWFHKRGVKVFCKITDERGGLKGHSFLSSFLGINKRRKRRLNDISGYIAISSEIEEVLLSVGVRQELIFRIPNGVNTDRFFPLDCITTKTRLREKYGFDQQDFIILFVGGISKRKQPFELVKILKKCIDENYKFKLILLGPDRSGKHKELDKILAYIDSHNLHNVCYYYDHTTIPEEFYQLADVFALPSINEGMSNAVLESLASGLPAIVTPVSGMSDLIISNHNGFIVNLDLFYEKFVFYYENKLILKDHSKSARDIILRDFSAQIVLNKHLSVFFSADY